MAKLFVNQAKQYAGTRPTYPPELFHFIASKTPAHDLVWDVGTGSGQAAQSLSCFYKNVVGTDTSLQQLQMAPKLPNVRYHQTPPILSQDKLEQIVSTQSGVDLVTIAQALHWFDHPKFYEQVKWVLKKPHGTIAAWCYTVPEVNDSVDAVFKPFYSIESNPFWEPERKHVDDRYSSIEFPFEPVEGTDRTGPFEFVAEKLMNLEEYFTYIRSWSAYQTAKEKGVELLKDEVIESFKLAWNKDGPEQKVVRFPIFLRIGKVGNF
ncbi:hypothetical protein K2173_011027 [Erythroxylum novogranatense]|uniref:Methyltransferase type 11 domain-containing protein n=1 Tax=Erythroxylum novogranatense TaxID=1862640 RepID=A0AAV8T192_9ROSI|nr:hypothetical protein K2173_011027 [Erythroxylum novogranatense]